MESLGIAMGSLGIASVSAGIPCVHGLDTRRAKREELLRKHIFLFMDK